MRGGFYSIKDLKIQSQSLKLWRAEVYLPLVLPAFVGVVRYLIIYLVLKERSNLFPVLHFISDIKFCYASQLRLLLN